MKERDRDVTQEESVMKAGGVRTCLCGQEMAGV